MQYYMCYNKAGKMTLYDGDEMFCVVHVIRRNARMRVTCQTQAFVNSRPNLPRYIRLNE